MNKQILVIGNRGYIGSALMDNLSKKYEIYGVDTCWYSNSTPNTFVMDYESLDKEFLSKFDIVILLAGHSSVKMCDGGIEDSYKNNVKNFINLIKNLNSEIKLIYASSSSVYGKYKGIADETISEFIGHNNYDITKHIIDLYVEKSNIEYYGLRFGTVNGYSPILRSDLMINSMYVNGMENGEINLYNKDIMRPILGMNDLIEGIKKIIECESDERGIYNMSSFNKTAGEIAYEVSNIIKRPVSEYNEDPNNQNDKTVTYDFQIDSSKFERTFNFKFKETIKTIVSGLQLHGFKSTKRNERKNYE